MTTAAPEIVTPAELKGEVYARSLKSKEGPAEDALVIASELINELLFCVKFGVHPRAAAERLMKLEVRWDHLLEVD